MVYPGGPGTKITSVSTGNLCADVSDSCNIISGVFVLNALACQLTLRRREESRTRSVSRRDDKVIFTERRYSDWLSPAFVLESFYEHFSFQSCRFWFSSARMNPRLPVQRLTPSPPRRTPGITSPYQLQRAKTALLVPGRGPPNTGREWRTESASPWWTTSTTACRYEGAGSRG